MSTELKDAIVQDLAKVGFPESQQSLGGVFERASASGLFPEIYLGRKSGWLVVLTREVAIRQIPIPRKLQRNVGSEFGYQKLDAREARNILEKHRQRINAIAEIRVAQIDKVLGNLEYL